MIKKSFVFVICLLLVYGLGLLGSIFTSATVQSDWYQDQKPEFTPPNWVFPVAWNTLFFLISASLYLAWIHAKKKEKKLVAWMFGSNLFFNGLWSALFFGLQKPLLAFFDLVLIWITILGMMVVARKIDRRAAWLLVPYLLWVSFAGMLNWAFL